MSKVVAEKQVVVPVGVKLFPQQDAERLELEQFIHKVYSHQYQADIQHFMPILLGLRDHSGGYVAALGMRHADNTPLFLEHYLDQPVEEVLSNTLRAEQGEISRRSIVEVGNLAADHAGGSRWLIVALTAYLQGAGYDWVVFTGVQSLRNSFRKLGLKLFPLAQAELSRLPIAEQTHWGRYYETRPQVMAINVHHTFGVLERLQRFEQTLAVLKNIWQQSFICGHASLAQSFRKAS